MSESFRGGENYDIASHPLTAEKLHAEGGRWGRASTGAAGPHTQAPKHVHGGHSDDYCSNEGKGGPRSAPVLLKEGVVHTCPALHQYATHAKGLRGKKLHSSMKIQMIRGDGASSGTLLRTRLGPAKFREEKELHPKGCQGLPPRTKTLIPPPVSM